GDRAGRWQIWIDCSRSHAEMAAALRISLATARDPGLTPGSACMLQDARKTPTTQKVAGHEGLRSISRIVPKASLEEPRHDHFIVGGIDLLIRPGKNKPSRAHRLPRPGLPRRQRPPTSSGTVARSPPAGRQFF